MAVGFKVAVVLLGLFWQGALSLPTPNEPIYEDQVYQDQQQAAAPLGRPDFQALALEEFGKGLEADPYGSLPLWVADSHPCGDGSNNYRAWPGVTCTAPTGYVTAINLKNKGLAGTLPDSIAVLKSLRTLDISNNSFFGILPSAYSNLNSLEVVDLSHNELSGTLPAVYSSWDSVQSLELHHNTLTGTLPGSWAGLNLLEVMDLSSNNLTGTLPGSWARMQFLSVLDVHNNSLTGTLPAAWSEQRSLLQLDLGDNSIAGILPAEWAGGMDSLRGINVTGNSLSGSLPAEWSNMTSLQTLSVSHNQLTGPIPTTWGGLHNLYRVNITRNEGICGDVPSGVAQALDDANTTNLNSRCQWDTDANHLLEFKAGLSDPLGVLSSWKEASNPCGAEPWQGIVCQDGFIVAIKVENSALKGPLTDGLMKITRLQALHLEKNQLQGTLPSVWGDTAPEGFSAIDLSNNQLTGPLPEEWSQMTSLQTLDLSSNKLLGQLPDVWSNLKNLTILILGSNQGLNGTLPASWASLAALLKVHVDQSSIEGSLPASWAKLTSMQELGLSSNLLTGSVPQMWPKQLSSLKVLDLSGNQQMCGQLQEVPTDWTLRKTATGLGSQCKSQRGASAATAVIAGVCGGVVGAALLAAAAFMVYKSRQMPPGHLASRWPSIAAVTDSISRLRSQTAAAGAAIPTAAGPMASPAAHGSPAPSANACRTPPTTPLTGPLAAAGVSTATITAAAAAAGGHHRLAVGTSAADSPSSISPRSRPGPVAEEALVGASELLDGHSSATAHLVGLINQHQRPHSCPGSPGSPLVQTDTGLNPEATAAGHASPASSMPSLISAPLSSRRSLFMRIPTFLPFVASPGRQHRSHTNSIAASPAATPPGGASSPAATPRRHSSMTGGSVAAAESGNMETAHHGVSSTRSLPGSPGAWGSAIKAQEHGDHTGAGPSSRAGGLDGFMARIAMMRMAEAAVAGSYSDGDSTISPPSSEIGAGSGATSASRTPIMSGRASPVLTPGRASPLISSLGSPARSLRSLVSGPAAAATAAAATEIAMNSERDCGSPMPAAQPASIRAFLMNAGPSAAETVLPSPRGVAALMAAVGAAADPIVGEEAGEVLTPDASTAPSCAAPAAVSE